MQGINKMKEIESAYKVFSIAFKPKYTLFDLQAFLSADAHFNNLYYSDEYAVNINLKEDLEEVDYAWTRKN